MNDTGEPRKAEKEGTERSGNADWKAEGSQKTEKEGTERSGNAGWKVEGSQQGRKDGKKRHRETEQGRKKAPKGAQAPKSSEKPRKPQGGPDRKFLL